MLHNHDGVTWEWLGPVLEPSGDGWDAYEIRISCVLSDELASRAEDNYRERTGIARREHDGRWTSVTAAAPALAARYVAFDGDRFFWEHDLGDGSHELRVAQPSSRIEDVERVTSS